MWGGSHEGVYHLPAKKLGEEGGCFGGWGLVWMGEGIFLGLELAWSNDLISSSFVWKNLDQF